MSSELENAQRVLEQNEDILAAIVENLQLGRLNDCMQHYSILQANLVSLATHLDNFPADESDPYTKLNIFPDEIMRKDLLEDFRPAGSKPLPKSPVVPPCADCLLKKNSAVMCRGTLKHVEPSGKYSAAEREEFYNVTQVLSTRPIANRGEGGGRKRIYKVWAPFEKYTLLVGISIFGTDMQKLNQILEERNIEQIRNYITKKLKKADKWIVHFNAVDLMNHRPNGYQPPPLLAPHFAAHALGLDPDTMLCAGFVPPTDPNNGDPAATTATESLLAPEAGKPDFSLLLSIAAGVSTHKPEDLPTRVPPAPSSTNSTFSDVPFDDVTIITDVGVGQTQGGFASSARQESAYKTAASAASASLGDAAAAAISRYSSMGPPASKAASQVSSYSSTRTPSQYTGASSSDGRTSGSHQSVNMLPQQSVQGELTQSSSFSRRVHWNEALVHESNREGGPAGGLFAQSVAQNVPYYALPVESVEEKEAKLETQRREESALLGLDAYNLEYARVLQAANIPFKMTSGTGTVVVVKGNGVQTASAPVAKSQAPPFARPGMQRKKQQQQARQQELKQLAQLAQSSQLDASQQLLLQQRVTQVPQTHEQQQPPQSQPPSRLAHRITAGMYSDLPPGGLHYPIHTDSDPNAANDLAPDSFAARLQAALKPRASPLSARPGAKAAKKTKPKPVFSQMMDQSIPIAGSDGNGTNSSSGESNAQPSLFSRILSGTNIESGSSNSRNHSKSRRTDSTFSSGNAHSSAALEVSMSGYEEDDDHLRSSAEGAGMELVPHEELSVLPEFGCEFSFL